jgi:hypothetical protein
MKGTLAETKSNGAFADWVTPVTRQYVNDAVFEFQQWYEQELASGTTPPNTTEMVKTQKDIIKYWREVIAQSKTLTTEEYFDITPYFTPNQLSQPDIMKMFDLIGGANADTGGMPTNSDLNTLLNGIPDLKTIN